MWNDTEHEIAWRLPQGGTEHLPFTGDLARAFSRAEELFRGGQAEGPVIVTQSQHSPVGITSIQTWAVAESITLLEIA